MTETIVYVDRSDIRTADLDRLRHAMTELVDFIKSREPQLLSYDFFVDEGASRMTVIAIHPDAASLELHLEVGGPQFRQFAELIDLRSIDVYGQPSPTVLGQLQQKARALGDSGQVTVHQRQAGFMRLREDQHQPPG